MKSKPKTSRKTRSRLAKADSRHSQNLAIFRKYRNFRHYVRPDLL